MDTDASGRYHNTAVVRFVEGAEAALMRERGVNGIAAVTPRARYEVGFRSPLWFGQEVTVNLVLERIGTSSMTFRFEVWGEELAASGRYVTVHVPKPGLVSAPWPPEWVAALRHENPSSPLAVP